MANIEQMINYQLNKVPGVKKYIKRAYQLGCYAVSKKIKSEGNIIKVSPDDPLHEYFFAILVTSVSIAPPHTAGTGITPPIITQILRILFPLFAIL